MIETMSVVIVGSVLIVCLLIRFWSVQDKGDIPINVVRIIDLPKKGTRPRTIYVDIRYQKHTLFCVQEGIMSVYATTTIHDKQLWDALYYSMDGITLPVNTQHRVRALLESHLVREALAEKL